MTYLQGFVTPVRPGGKDAYREMSATMAPIVADYGATAMVECWGEDVPEGKRTDFRRAVDAGAGEDVAFSWVTWPDRATCDAAQPRMMEDERMQPTGDMPFDMGRMIFGGFEVVSDDGDGGAFGWIDGMVGAVPDDRRQAFVDHAAFMAPHLLAKGATRVVNGWGVDVPDGKRTDFRRAVDARPGETVTFGWIEWPDKATHDAGWGALMTEGLMQRNPPAWDGARAIFGGFVPLNHPHQA